MLYFKGFKDMMRNTVHLLKTWHINRWINSIIDVNIGCLLLAFCNKKHCVAFCNKKQCCNKQPLVQKSMICDCLCLVFRAFTVDNLLIEQLH